MEKFLLRLACLGQALEPITVPEVLLHNFDVELIQVTAAVRAVTGTTLNCLPIQACFIALNVARRFFAFEYNDAIGPDFMQCTARRILETYTIREKVDTATRYTVQGYLDLFAAQDAKFKAGGPLADMEVNEDSVMRATYRERRRWHYDTHLAQTVYRIGLDDTLQMQDPVPRSLRYHRNLEWFLQKMLLIDGWMTQYRADGTSPTPEMRYVAMSAPLSKARVGIEVVEFLTYALPSSALEKDYLDTWVAKREQFEEHYAKNLAEDIAESKAQMAAQDALGTRTEAKVTRRSDNTKPKTAKKQTQ